MESMLTTGNVGHICMCSDKMVNKLPHRSRRTHKFGILAMILNYNFLKTNHSTDFLCRNKFPTELENPTIQDYDIFFCNFIAIIL